MMLLARSPTSIMRAGWLELAPAMVAALIASAVPFGCSRRSSDSGSGLRLIEGRALAEAREGVDAGTKATPPRAYADLDEAAEAKASQVAFSWLASLAKHDSEALAVTSRIPFVLREGRSGGRCKNAILKDADQLRAALKCLVEDATLTKVLRANSDPQGGPVPRKYLPNWAEK